MALKTTAFEAMAARGWSIRDLSERSGIPLFTLYSVKRRYRNPGPSFIAGIMRAFPDLPYERLFTSSDSANAQINSAREQAA